MSKVPLIPAYPVRVRITAEAVIGQCSTGAPDLKIEVIGGQCLRCKRQGRDTQVPLNCNQCASCSDETGP